MRQFERDCYTIVVLHFTLKYKENVKVRYISQASIYQDKLYFKYLSAIYRQLVRIQHQSLLLNI